MERERRLKGSEVKGRSGLERKFEFYPRLATRFCSTVQDYRTQPTRR